MRPSFPLLLAALIAGCGPNEQAKREPHDEGQVCCAFPYDIRVAVVDESGRGIPGVPVDLTPLDHRGWAGVERTDSAGVAVFHGPTDSAYYRVAITPPPGFVPADSTPPVDTLLYFRTSGTGFVLRRKP